MAVVPFVRVWGYSGEMMEKKKGIKLFAIIAVLYAILLFITNRPGEMYPLAVTWLIIGGGLYKQFTWARYGIISISVFHIIRAITLGIINKNKIDSLIDILIVLTSYIFFFIIIYYFTRPKVKEQFK